MIPNFIVDLEVVDHVNVLQLHWVLHQGDKVGIMLLWLIQSNISKGTIYQMYILALVFESQPFSTTPLTRVVMTSCWTVMINYLVGNFSFSSPKIAQGN